MTKYKKENYYKNGLGDEEHCDICGLYKSEDECKKSGEYNLEIKNSFCLVRQQIFFIQEKILGIGENNRNAKPKVTPSVSHEWSNKEIKKFRKEHNISEDSFENQEFVKKPLPNFKSMDEVDFVYIESTKEFQVMHEKLLQCREIGVNLEYYSQRSYLGFTWLLQISTEDTYYMIDCIKLQKELHMLNTIFMDTTILKIFHDGENAIRRLGKEFRIFISNIFDTAVLQNIIMESKEIDLLRDNMFFENTQIHTHFLIFLQIYMTNFLLKMQRKKFLTTMRQICKKNCENVHQKLNGNKITFKNLPDYQVTNQERYFALELLIWRDKIAKKEDESPNFILPDNYIFKIARELLFDKNNTNTFSRSYGARFLKNKETTFNINEAVLRAKKISNKKKKNLKWYLEYYNQQLNENAEE